MRHVNIRKNLSAYLDGEMDEASARKIRRHIQGCPSCQSLEGSIRKGKALASHFETPAWSGTERLWQNIRGQISVSPRELSQTTTPLREKVEFAGRSRRIRSGFRPAIVAGILAALVFANLFVIFRGDGNEYQMAGPDWMSDYVFDYGLYLAALTDGQKPTDFEIRYGSRAVTYDQARRAMPFRLASFSTLPEGYRLADVRLLKNACCHSVQCTIRKPSSDLVIFQQPKEHPFAFGNFPSEIGSTGGSPYHKVEAGPYQALSWVGEESRFIAVGEMVEKDIATLISAVTE